MTEQKEQEYQIFNLFRRLHDDFPRGQVVPNESPDFLVRLNRRSAIGIELTELRGQEFYEQRGHYSHPEMIKEQIEKIIHAKEEKIHLYQRHKPAQLWLLIHIGSFDNLIHFNLKDKIERWGFAADFNRVFLLEIKTQNLIQLV